ncbi:SmpA/OmlA family outer membrane lipoprotein [Pseudomonas syringae]|uniref:SmpA/OmlA family outer membrane lipoprotein n=1 Tax=Pseudomonas syringae TaxID=317 RepID=A0A1C7Z8Z1_PSESX|nr:outer membrane protein assembly factor BamE [Pseudomonas syringae]OCR25660.1 SmpA/OmlA family outer membrane lipoprotein [Pseudomonas syringae]
MTIQPRQVLCSALLCLPLSLHATIVQRCEDPAGNVTYTSLGCPSDHGMQLQNAFNAPPGSKSNTALLPPQDQPPRRQSRATATATHQENQLTVVGQRDDGCGNRLSAEQRRRAIINQQTPPGMTKRDVESLLGRPDKVVSRNGETRYTYNAKKGRSSQVTFDEMGCVKGKR